MSVRSVPEGYHTVTPYLIVDGAAAAIEFYRKAFGAVETLRLDDGGKVSHAEIRIGDSTVMLADGVPEQGYQGPVAYGGTPVSLLLYLPDVDRVFGQAVAAGAKVRREVRHEFYGDRSGTIEDPFGHVWTIATHVEDVSPEEMRRRYEELTAKK